MLRLTWKIILCDSIPYLDFLCINACAVIRNESQVCSSVCFSLSMQRKMGRARRTLLWRWRWESQGPCGRKCAERGKSRNSEGPRPRRRWGWSPMRGQGPQELEVESTARAAHGQAWGQPLWVFASVSLDPGCSKRRIFFLKLSF